MDTIFRIYSVLLGHVVGKCHLIPSYSPLKCVGRVQAKPILPTKYAKSKNPKESERIQESLPEKSVLKFLDAEISFFLVLAISSSLYTSRSKDFVPLRNQWIGLRENLLENPEIAWESLWPMVSYRFSLKPIHCRKGKRSKHQEKGMKKYLTHHTMLCGTFGQKLEALILPRIHVNTTC